MRTARMLAGLVILATFSPPTKALMCHPYDGRRGCKTVKTYKKYDFAATHAQALFACKKLGGLLALPTNKDEDDQLIRTIGFRIQRDREVFYWISGNDQQEEGKWIDNNTGEPLLYTNFDPSNPSNSGGNEDCLEIAPTYLTWNDRNCDAVGTGYVCEFMKEYDMKLLR